jgi:Ni/Co efflux regulator RcnB
MKRTSALLAAALVAAAPMAAVAQDRERPQRPDRREEPDLRERMQERPRVSMAQAVQRASAGRPGRFLGASNRGDMIVVRWEYPGGRVADILVDGRTGRVIGER